MPARLKQNIDQGWKFCRGAALGAEPMDFDASRWADVDLPHDWSIEGPVDEGNPAPTGFHPQGIGWYRKEFVLDKSRAGRVITIEFEGIFRNSTLWVNGGWVGTHAYGYTGVAWDITRHVRCDGRSNVIAVKIDCPPAPPYWPGWGWWYEGCGIYRHVWLIATDPLHVDQWGTFVATPRVSESEATVRVRISVRSDGPFERECRVRTSLLDALGQKVAEMASDGSVVPKSRKDFTAEASIASPRLWSPDSPNLYLAKTEVVCDGRTVDTYETPFGIRWFEFTSDRGFFLNGKRVQIRGWNVHNDFGGLGMALPDRANYRTVELMKEAGCNFLRSAHHDATPSLMDACDKLGLLVWGENRYMGPAETAVPPLRDLIRRNRNHPSIICWGLANTAGWKNGDPTETLQLQACNDAAHEEDPTRPTTFACEGNADAIANGFGFVTDILGYNGNGQGIDDRDHDRHPNRKLMISETNGPGGARGVYEEQTFPDSREGLRFTVQPGGWLYRCSGQYRSMYDCCSQLEIEWSHLEGRPWLAGAALWAGIEYMGESAGWPMVTGQFGVLDLCRFRKDAWYFFLQEWTTAPMVHVFPHWTWPGKEGQTIDVWGYTNGDSVELFLNGRSLGVRERKPLGHVEWKAPYQPGTLRAVAKKDGKIVAQEEHRTAGPPAAIDLSADRVEILADAQDVSFITVSIADAQGVFCPTADNAVRIEIEGAGRILGMCSGDPRSHDNPKATNPLMTFNGLLLAIVQSDGKPGSIAVKASSPGLSSASIQLNAR